MIIFIFVVIIQQILGYFMGFDIQKPLCFDSRILGPNFAPNRLYFLLFGGVFGLLDGWMGWGGGAVVVVVIVVVGTHLQDTKHMRATMISECA